VPTRWMQDRQQASHENREGAYVFANEADTDFSLASNRDWIAPFLRSLHEQGLDVVTPCIGGRFVSSDGDQLETVLGHDPYEPDRVAYRWTQANEALIDQAVSVAKIAGEGWRSRSRSTRKQLLLDVADELAEQRGLLIGVMARDAGKVLKEADTEVSEAIDLVRYYAMSVDSFEALESDGARFTPFGTVLVVPPWNFPVAIPIGGVAAALAAGNAVILKPAPETVAVAWIFANAFWTAGVSKEVLQFVPCADGDVGQRLVTHPDVNAVVLTGSWDTARMFLGWRPDLELHAETSGKNAIVVTATADLDNAIADVVRSAFGHAGQKCSAASLVILEASVYDNPDFQRRLVDATKTLRTGPGWDPRTTLSPLIRPPEGALADALNRLDAGEEWLLKPESVDGSDQVFTPGIKLGVMPGSTFHVNECFGPVLGLMRAKDLDEAIEFQNASMYGLTAGIHSLDSEETRIWTESVQAGNLYINRQITGAIVQRQPFGGWKRSVIGPGAKAGGPNYVGALGSWTSNFDGEASAFEAEVRASVDRDLAPSDRSGLFAEANVLRYVPMKRVLLRASAGMDDKTLSLAVAAGRGAGIEVVVSSSVIREVATALVVEDDDTLISRLTSLGKSKDGPDRIRFLGAPVDQLRLAAIDSGISVDDRAFVAHPRLEARRWFLEQAVSETKHRHGNVSGHTQMA